MWPLIELAIEAKSADDHSRLSLALAQIASGSPVLSTAIDHESGLSLLLGFDEPSLDKAIQRLIDVHGLDIRVGAPQVAYRETITQRVEVDYSHKKVHGPKGEFARVVLMFEPGAPNSGFVFSSSASADAIPEEFVAGVAAGLEANRAQGLLAGYPVIDMTATLVDGAYHDIDSSPLAFDIAARMAFKSLRKEGAPVLLEPVMAIEISAPQACIDAVVSDLLAYRGAVTVRNGRVTGLVPLAWLFGYARRLDVLTDGQGVWSMAFDHYAPVPQEAPPDDSYISDIGLRA